MLASPVFLMLSMFLIPFSQEVELIEAAAPEAGQAVTVGRPAAERLMNALKQELLSAMQSGGPAHAVDFCSQEALALTERVSAELGGLGLKRTTLRPRNPANAPDDMELQVLRVYTESPRQEHLSFTVQKIKGERGVFYRYYEPVYTAGLCLACHGEKISSDVREVLSSKYPGDQATGYRDGDFRGLIRVELPVEEIEE